jgi:hypothetical protein
MALQKRVSVIFVEIIRFFRKEEGKEVGLLRRICGLAGKRFVDNLLILRVYLATYRAGALRSLVCSYSPCLKSKDRTSLPVAWKLDSIKAKPCGCALAAPSLDRDEPPCLTRRWQG